MNHGNMIWLLISTRALGAIFCVKLNTSIECHIEEDFDDDLTFENCDGDDILLFICSLFGS